MSQYRYNPLDNESIRTLELLPGEFEDPLKACIVHRIFIPVYRWDDIPGRWVPIYEALSYAWGEQDDLEMLSIVDDPTEDDSFLRIGKNLSFALRDLRSTSESRIIWCDAVCINQQDLAERATQVQRMADIYRHADRVVVWLAPDDKGVAQAFQILDRFGSHVYYDIDKTKLYTHEGMDKTYLRKDYILPLNDYDWQCIRVLLSLSWFTRLWVRQEIALANDSALLTSGRHQLLWSKFCSAVAYLERKVEMSETVVEAAQGFGMKASFRNARSLIDCKILATNFFNVVASLDPCQCADPRDKIYGVLGLQTDFNIPVDYTKTAKEVYTDWALGYYRHHSKLEFLELCEMAGYPSWVPDLAMPRNVSLGFVKTDSALQTRAVFNNLPDQMCKMLATHCGTITAVTTTMPNQPDPEVIREKLQSWTSQLFPQGIQAHDALKIEELATAVSGGRATERRDEGRFKTMGVTNELLRPRVSFPRNSDLGQMYPKVFIELSHLLPGAAALATKDGHFGLGSGAVHIGDEIFVLLGCNYPMIMRSVEDSKYRVVAPCYFPHLSRGEAILGQLPDGWKAMFDIRGYLYFVAPDGSRTLEDPRLGNELSPGWEQEESPDHSYLLWARPEDDKWRAIDPRQTPERLEARGVKLEMITVV